MGDTVLGEKTITVESAQGGKEVDFEVVFNTLSELPQPDKPIFVPLRASLSPDRLAADDERFLAAPVVAALPVVFVDQYGAEGEDPIQGLVGETRPLRKLLAPKTARSDAPRQLVKVRHITLEDLTQDVLADARLVVIAGLQEPGDAAPLLAGICAARGATGHRRRSELRSRCLEHSRLEWRGRHPAAAAGQGADRRGAGSRPARISKCFTWRSTACRAKTIFS